MNFRYLNMLAAAALLCACQSAPKQTTITGTLTGIESDTLIVNYSPVSDLTGARYIVIPLPCSRASLPTI